jgi:hypothetical protein
MCDSYIKEEAAYSSFCNFSNRAYCARVCDEKLGKLKNWSFSVSLKSTKYIFSDLIKACIVKQLLFAIVVWIDGIDGIRPRSNLSVVQTPYIYQLMFTPGPSLAPKFSI